MANEINLSPLPLYSLSLALHSTNSLSGQAWWQHVIILDPVYIFVYGPHVLNQTSINGPKLMIVSLRSLM